MDEDLDYRSIVRGMGGRATAARQQAVEGANANPEEAADSLRMSKVSGVHPYVIDLDPQQYKEQYNEETASAAVTADPLLQDYINSRPLAAKVSNDDWEQLSTIGKLARSFENNPLWHAVKGFQEGFGGYQQEEKPVADVEAEIVQGAIGAPAIKTETMGPGELMSRMTSGAVHGAAKGGAVALTQLAETDPDLKRMVGTDPDALERQIGAMLEWHIGRGDINLAHAEPRGHGLVPEDAPKGAIEVKFKGQFHPVVQGAMETAAPYFAKGEMVPAGVHPLFDQFWKETAKQDHEFLKNLEKEVQKSKTFERAPGEVKAFLDQAMPGRTISIPAEKIRELYGDKEPAVDDGILGWIPDLKAQLAAAEWGGDVEIPLSEWVTRENPETTKDLGDWAHVREGGLSLEESKELPDKEPGLTAPEDLARSEAALAPMVESGQTGRLRKVATHEDGYDEYEIIGDKGKVGDLVVQLTPKNLLYVETIGSTLPSKTAKGIGATTTGVQALGLSQIRNIAQELQREYPTATHIGGYRVSGARMEATKAGVDKTGWVEIPLKRLLAEDPKDAVAFANEIGWTSVEGGTEGGRALVDRAKLGGETVELNGATAEPVMSISTRELLDHIQLDHLPEVPKLLQGFFRGKLADLVGHVDVRWVSPEDMNNITQGVRHKETTDNTRIPGFYHPEGDYIVLNTKYMNAGPKGLAHLVMHEVDHAATWNIIKNNPEIRNGIKSIMGEIEQNFPEIAEKHSYAFQNEGEFAAETRANPKLEQELATAPLSKELKQKLGLSDDTKTLWDAVRNYISSILEKLIGAKPEATALDGMLKFYEQMEKEYQKLSSEDVAFAPEDIAKGDPKAANDNVKFKLPEPKTIVDRTWDNYTKKMSEEEMLQSEAVWGGAKRISELEGISEAEGFAYLANDYYARNSINKFMTPQVAKRLMASQRGIGEVAFAPEDPLFENAKVYGYNKEQFAKHQELVRKENEERMAREQARAEKYERKKQTGEYKAREKELREETREAIDNRPDIAADRFMRRGPLGQIKFDSSVLTPEQKAALPREYYGVGGVNPSEISGYFGFSSGEALVNGIADLKALQKEAKLEPAEYIKSLVNEQVEAQLKKEFGDLEENILASAREAIRTPTMMERLTEELMVLMQKAGIDPTSFKFEEVQKARKAEFTQLPVGQARKPSNFLTGSRWASARIEESQREGKWSDAAKFAMQRVNAELQYKESLKLAKEFDQNQKLLKRFRERSLKGVDQTYTDQIHGIMDKIGEDVKRGPADLRKALSASSLEDFVASKARDLRPIPLDDYLLDPNFKKPIDEMMVEEFRSVSKTLKSLAFHGANELKVEKGMEKVDREAVRDRMVEQLETFGKAKSVPLEQGGGFLAGIKKGEIGYALRVMTAAHVQMETWLNRWDRFNPKGDFKEYIFRPLAAASNHFAKLEREYSQRVKGLKDNVNVAEIIDNPLFKDEDGVTYQMTRGNLRTVLLNMGNESNLKKLTEGYKVSPDALRTWAHNVAKKEDWDFAQGMWDIFKDINKLSTEMYTRLAGVGPEAIEAAPFQVKIGEDVHNYAGGYYPVIFDKVQEGTSKKLMGRDPLANDEFFSALPAAGYTKGRTGYTAPLTLAADQSATRMRQMLYDIAMREAIVQADKFFRDPELRGAIAKHSMLGREVRDSLVPYLQDVANRSNIDSEAANVAARWSNFFRQNVVSTLVGLNPGTLAKHGTTAFVQSVQEVGPVAFATELNQLLMDIPRGSPNWKLAMEKSAELQRRHRHYSETLGGGYQEAFGENNLRSAIQHWGSYPVAMSDLMSAVPTWLVKYKEAIRDGENEGHAVELADESVRRAHGSTATTSRPAVMRGGAMAQWFTSLYGFFSHIMNRQLELMWRAGDQLGINKVPQDQFIDNKKAVIGGVLAYIVLPALIEEAVTPLTNDKHESWGMWTFKALAKQLSASWIPLRDPVQAILSGHEPTGGLIGTLMHFGHQAATDVITASTKGKDKSDAMIEHGAAALGGIFGLANAQMGRTGKFLYNSFRGKEHPKSITGIEKPSQAFSGMAGSIPGSWLYGLRHGTAKPPRKK